MSSADQARSYRFFYYLCAALGYEQQPNGDVNAAGVGALLGNRELRRAVTALLQPEKLSAEECETRLRRLGNTTTGTAVQLLSHLRQNLAAAYQAFELPPTRVLGAEEVLTALSYLVELTPKERRDLGLPAGDGLTLLQRSLLMLQTVGGLENYEMLLHIYKAAVGLDFTRAEEPLTSLAAVDDLIAQVVRQSLAFLPRQNPARASASASRREDTVTELTRKVQREVRRLLARSGNQQLATSGDAIVNSYVRQYLQPAFVTKLAQTIGANERLTDQLPVYLKRISFVPSGPLPFADRELDVLTQGRGPYPPLLHPALRDLDQGGSLAHYPDLPGPGDYELASQEATQVSVEFYVKVPPGYQPSIDDVFERLSSQDGRRIDFSLSSTGIGGSLSHVIKVINRALLQDIPCLGEFFPIAHDVTSTQAIIRDNVASPVWAHSLVKLCRRQLLGETLNACQDDQFSNYADFSFADPIGHGDFCGFDFLLSQAQASLQARLQAIRNAGVQPSTYIRQLCHRVERSQAMQDAWTCLRGYPFSSLAMIGLIQQTLMPTQAEAALGKSDPYIYFDACLSITEALLDEGVYRPARAYLRRLEGLDPFVAQGLETSRPSGEPFEVFSGALVIRYLLCLAHYYYLYDTRDREPEYLPPGCQADVNRDILVQRAWETLDQAQRHVSLRLRKYVVLNEVSQGTFHPHYLLLSRIAFLRTKLMLFFPRRVPRDEDYLPTESFVGRQRTAASIHWGRLFLAEKARLYAAADGDSEIYACHAAIQAWIYLIAAYAGTSDLNLAALNNGDRPRQLDPKQCLAWARRLRNHALITYAETGRQCYYQIKEKSGLRRDNLDSFGPYCIEKIPPIFETRDPPEAALKQAEERPHVPTARPGPTTTELLVLDMSLLAVNPKDLPRVSPHHPTRNIYLFGTNACYLFFIRGLLMACTNVAQEFDDEEAPATQIDWDAKLRLATRLLHTAWATAEEGGTVEKDVQDGQRIFRIARSFNRDGQTSTFSSPEIDSIRDLYPRRIAEISDLGKIFAIACMVLRLALVPEGDRAALEADIDALLASLYNAESLQNCRTHRALLSRQKRYNGHLESYLSYATDCLQRHRAEATAPAQPSQLRQRRDRLMGELFAGLSPT
ncbi:hypothetical protein [Leptolyngbya sp. KIOST-1]|uniref:hypothetical protein n=1 Tax=Leptolyngbya sp. KIOST-1 TaxID=1229172 RepID=UPI0005641D65|nr:hypothetical protein [Leptolyngbya sp. KIOST-1]